MSRLSPSSLLLPNNTTINSNGLWKQNLSPSKNFQGRPALYVDRDGVIVVETNYLHQVEQCELIDGVEKLLVTANQMNIPVIMVTNQGGIGREIFDWPDFMLVQQKIHSDLSDLGAHIDAVLSCPHHPLGTPPYDDGQSYDRKPNPGMLMAARDMLNIDLNSSWIVGDRFADLEAGKQAGLSGGVLVSTGYGHEQQQQQMARGLNGPDFQVKTASSLGNCIIPILLPETL